MGYYIYIHQQWDIIYIYPIVDTWGIELKPMKAICFTHWIEDVDYVQKRTLNDQALTES
jgi:hypothetical protein